MAKKTIKCYFCKKEINKDDAYMWEHVVEKSGKIYKRYCCSEEEKEQVERDKELYKLIQYLTDEILGYPCVNNTRNKKIQELQEAGFSNETIYRCFKQYKDEIVKWIEFNGIDKEFNKLSYMFGVIKNVIKDFECEDERKNSWEQYKEKEEEIEIEVEEEVVPLDMKVKKRKKLF
jgi:hypothetical protein